MNKTAFIKRGFLIGALLLAFSLLTVRCVGPEPSPSDQPIKGEDTIPSVVVPPVEFELLLDSAATSPIYVVPEQPYKIKYRLANATTITAGELPAGWSVEIQTADSCILVRATTDAISKVSLQVSATDTTDQKVSHEVALQCLNFFDDPRGAFVLNEGNMTTENGSLTYITSEGQVFDDAYKMVNGTELGNVAQDMSFCNGKIYIISQNGELNATGTSFENDGLLVIVNAKTLKREQAFTKKELSTLDWPSHIAALDEEHVYIRDNKGIYRLNIKSKELTFITGSEGAPKSQFLTINGKVYTYKTGSIGGILEISPDKDEVRKISYPFKVEVSINQTLGIRAAEDGDIWVMSFGFGKTAIGKFNLASKKIVQRQISVHPIPGSSGVTFAAQGNDLYYMNEEGSVFRLKFNPDPALKADSGLEAEEELVSLSELSNKTGIVYNGPAIHPVTGQFYINTIKSFPDFTKNVIWVFDFNHNTEKPVAQYEDYTNFPAGVYFSPSK